MPDKPNALTPAIGYVRVSVTAGDKTKEEEGLSLANQAEKIRAYAKLYFLDLLDIEVDDGESAKTLDRPGLKRALAQIHSGLVQALVVLKLDRLTRSVRDLGDLIEKHFTTATLHSVQEKIDTSSAGGRLVLNVLMSVAQWEREAIGERTSAVMQYKQKHGEYTGGKIPYGYGLSVDGVRLVENADEQAVIDVARQLYSTEPDLSLRKLAEELRTRGFVSRSGASFHPQQVKALLLPSKEILNGDD